jgi:hypothetical protein
LALSRRAASVSQCGCWSRARWAPCGTYSTHHTYCTDMASKCSHSLPDPSLAHGLVLTSLYGCWSRARCAFCATACCRQDLLLLAVLLCKCKHLMAALPVTNHCYTNTSQLPFNTISC